MVRPSVWFKVAEGCLEAGFRRFALENVHNAGQLCSAVVEKHESGVLLSMGKA